MSEILIKGMEMPKSCGECRASGTDVCRKWMGKKNLKVRSEDCPLVELPPHGRLGDLDLMKEDFDASLRATRQLVDLDSDSPFYGLQQRDLANAEKLVNGLIDKTPIVLEASEVKE